MVGVAGVVVWIGYSVFAFGISQVRGCNAGFLNMINPFAAQPQCNPDTGGLALTPGTGKVNSNGTANIPPPGSPGNLSTAQLKALGGGLIPGTGQISPSGNANIPPGITS